MMFLPVLLIGTGLGLAFRLMAQKSDEKKQKALPPARPEKPDLVGAELFKDIVDPLDALDQVKE